MSLHPLIERAARGELPEWAQASRSRREHIGRVAELMARWSVGLGADGDDRARFAAAGFLHDVLRDADPDSLRGSVPSDLCDLPGRILHGPAAAERLRREGFEDEELLRAVAYHTLGHGDFGLLGRALYVADFLEPGRDLRNQWRGDLRARMPEGLLDVTREVLAARIAHVTSKGRRLRPETVGFWNSLVTEDA